MPDRTGVVGGGAGGEENRVGTRWGIGFGLEGGLRIPVTSVLYAQLASAALYQTVYSGNRTVLWDLSAGVSIDVR